MYVHYPFASRAHQGQTRIYSFIVIATFISTEEAQDAIRHWYVDYQFNYARRNLMKRNLTTCVPI